MAKVEYTNFDYAAKTAELESILAQLQSSETTLDNAIQLHDDTIRSRRNLKTPPRLNIIT